MASKGSSTRTATTSRKRTSTATACPTTPSTSPGPNRSYSAERADATAAPSLSFELRPHQLTPEQNAVKKNYLNTGNEDPEVRAIYLYKEGSSSLYRLRLE